MSHQTVIMNGGESPLASTLKERAPAPAYENQPSAAHASPTNMDGGAAPIPGQTPAPSAPSTDPSGVAGIGGGVRPRS